MLFPVNLPSRQLAGVTEQKHLKRRDSIRFLLFYSCHECPLRSVSAMAAVSPALPAGSGLTVCPVARQPSMMPRQSTATRPPPHHAAQTARNCFSARRPTSLIDLLQMAALTTLLPMAGVARLGHGSAVQDFIDYFQQFCGLKGLNDPARRAGTFPLVAQCGL